MSDQNESNGPPSGQEDDEDIRLVPNSSKNTSCRSARYSVHRAVTRKVHEVIDDIDMRDKGGRFSGLAPLPIQPYAGTIVSTVGSNLVTIIRGETGSGKSTQVPQYVLAANASARIVVTQPTRLATIGAAKRVACELRSELGDLVGYRISGQGATAPQTRIIFATAGWLLQLLVHAKFERPSFTHVIVDEVHERSIDSDLLCLVIKLLLRKWPDGSVRMILMSATMQGGIFEDYFGQELGKAIPCLSVGVKRYEIEEVFLEDIRRVYPACDRLGCTGIITTLCRKMSHRPEILQAQIGPEVLTLAAKLLTYIAKPGETCLVFVAGMSEIDELHKLLEPSRRSGGGMETLICHSLVSLDDQVRAFTPNLSQGRVILATNVAESSVTLPDVRFVLDFGICKRVAYDQRDHRTVLRSSWISKASAKQRAGRTGRVCQGTVIRLYTRQIYEGFAGHDPPEMLVQPLEQVVLRLKLLAFGDVHETLAQCVEPPQLDQITDAILSLARLGALECPDKGASVTPLGHILSAMGIDLPLARTAVQGVILGYPIETAILTACMSSQDPFIIPHAASSANDDMKQFYELMSRTTHIRDFYAKGLGSDPLCLMFLFVDWLRCRDDNERRSFLRQGGLVQARMRALDSAVRNILRCLGPTGAVPGVPEMLRYARAPDFETQLLQPERLFLLRALLLGGFYPDMLVGGVKHKIEYTELSARSIRIGGLPSLLQDAQTLTKTLGTVGQVVNVQMTESNAAQVIFAGVREAGVETDWFKEGNLIYADEHPLGQFTGLAAPIKALMNSRGHGGELVLDIPGTAAYIGYGRGSQSVAIKDVQPAATFNVKVANSQAVVNLAKSCVLRNSAIPRREASSAIHLVTSSIQKSVSASGSAVTFRADNVTYLPYPEALLALIVAAFTPNEEVTLLRAPRTGPACRSMDGRPPNGPAIKEEEDDEDHDDSPVYGIEIEWLQAKHDLPTDIMRTINRFRYLISTSIADRGLIVPNAEACALLLGLFALFPTSTAQNLSGPRKVGNKLANHPIPITYYIPPNPTTHMLPCFRRKAMPQLTLLSASMPRGLKRPFPFQNGSHSNSAPSRHCPSTSAPAPMTPAIVADSTLSAVASMLPQFPSGIRVKALTQRLKDMGLSSYLDQTRFSRHLSEHGFKVEDNKVLPGTTLNGLSIMQQSLLQQPTSGTTSSTDLELLVVLRRIKGAGAKGMPIGALWLEFMAHFKARGVSKQRGVRTYLQAHGVRFHGETAFLGENIPSCSQSATGHYGPASNPSLKKPAPSHYGPASTLNGGSSSTLSQAASSPMQRFRVSSPGTSSFRAGSSATSLGNSRSR